MSFRMYQIWKGLTVMVLAALVAWSVSQGNAWIPIPAAAAALLIMFLAKRAVKKVVVDERSYTIANKASRITFQAGAVILVFVGATLQALSRGNYPELRPYADTLILSVLGLMILYLISILYYTGKHGGIEEI